MAKVNLNGFTWITEKCLKGQTEIKSIHILVMSAIDLSHRVISIRARNDKL